MRAIFVLLMLLASAAPAAAQGKGDLERARTLFAEAQVHYQVGEFSQAIEKYKEAYKLSEAPALLFNIAQAYRLDGNAHQALLFYQNYLRDVPEAENRGDAEARIAEMEALVAEQKRAAAEALAAEKQTKDQPMTVVIERREVSRGSRGMRIGGAVTGAAGLMSLGAGVFFGMRARSAWNDINTLSNEGGVWTSDFDDKYKGAERDETLATVFISVGAASLVAGGVLYYLGMTRGKTEKKVGLVPTPHGGAVSWTF